MNERRRGSTSTRVLSSRLTEGGRGRLTSYMTVTVGCPKCNHSFNFDYLASICTWLSPHLIERVITKPVNVRLCPECEQPIFLEVPVLINCTNGMFWMDMSIDFDEKKRIFREYGIIDDDDNVVNMKFSESSGGA